MGIHQDYLEELKQRRQDPFYQKQAKWLMRQAAPEYQRSSRQYQTYLNREGLPESLKAQASIEQNTRWADVVSGISDKMEMKEANRRRELEQKIDTQAVKAKAEKEQEEQRDKDIFGNVVSTVGSLAGAALTATGVGAPIGMAVSAASAGIGSAISGSPEQQMALLDRAGTEALGAIGQAADLKKDKTEQKAMNNLMENISGMGLDEKQMSNAMGMIGQQLQLGQDPEDVWNMMNKLYGGNDNRVAP